MKKILKKLFLNLVILWILAGLIQEIVYISFYDLVIAVIMLTLLQLLIKPIITILFMPINLLTLGFLSWVPQLILFYIFKYTSIGYQINPITIPQIQVANLSIAEIHLGNNFSLILFAILYFYLNKFLRWILK